MQDMMKLAALAAPLFLLTLAAVPAQAAAPTTATATATAAASAAPTQIRPGQFCSKADRGKKKRTKRYGVLRCTADGRYSRWR